MARPKGIEGHDDLYSHRMSGSRMLFKCRACDSLWQRDYAGEGAFVWTASPGEFLGSEVPGRRDPK